MANYNTMLAGLRDLVDNPTPRVPVGLCLDISGSMWGTSIKELNTGVQQYFDEIRSDDLTCYSAETAVVTFSDTAERVADFDTADHQKIPPFRAHGCTCMGEGLKMTMDLLDSRKNQYKATGVDYYQPILVVMSDGSPNGDPSVLSEVLDRIRQQVEQRRLTVIAVGIGPEADMVMLSRLSPKHRPFRLNGLQFREFFAWLSQSVASVSASMPGDETELDMDALQALEAQPWPDELK